MKYSVLLFWQLLLVVIVLGFIASVFTTPNVGSEWYTSLSTAPWTPPDLAFSIIWILLYLLIGITLYTGLINDSRGWVFGALATVGILLNVLWPYVFYVTQNILGGFIVLVLLDIVVAIQIIYLFSQPTRGAKITAGFLIFYLIWLAYATSLNGYLLNQ